VLSVLFVCSLLYYCHRVATQLQVNISNRISYYIILYHKDNQCIYYLFTRCILKVDYMFRLSSLGHHHFISFYPENYTIYDTIYEIKSFLFNEISFFVHKILLKQLVL
jgi:hypothetical protein